MEYTALELVAGVIDGLDARPTRLMSCDPIWIRWRAPKLLVARFSTMEELSKELNGAAVPPLQSSTSSALIVVGSSSAEAVKLGVALANALVKPVTMTGAPTVELVKSGAGLNATPY